MLRKISNLIEMSFDIPEAEKKIASEAIVYFEATSNVLSLSIKHIDIINEVFNEYQNISTESVVKNRGLLNRYSNKIKENFEKMQAYASVAAQKLNYFSVGDSVIQELVNSFDESVEDITDNVSELINILRNNFRAQDFRDQILTSIGLIKESAEDLETLIYDRIIEHIDTNILADNWRANTNKKMNIDVSDKAPLITELFNERQKILNPSGMPSSDKNNQALNAGDAQKQHYPDRLRNVQTGE